MQEPFPSSQQVPLDHDLLGAFLESHYASVKNRSPDEGRRRWRLRVAQQFWNLSSAEKLTYASSLPPIGDTSNAPFETDSDPLDDISGDDAPNLGLVIRTDYSNEPAWQEFVSRLMESEAEFTSASGDGDNEEAMDEDTAEPSSSSNHAMAAAKDENEDEEDDNEDESEEGSTPIFSIVNPPPSSPLHAILNNPSSPPTNLALLRLFTDVSIRPAPSRPADTSRFKPPNRLIDRDSWQEIYRGKGIWVYDAKSNTDQCARVVSLEGSSYGTATGDSWRARVSFICELQVNLASGAMKIDFGGLDRYDYEERLRNLTEAET